MPYTPAEAVAVVGLGSASKGSTPLSRQAVLDLHTQTIYQTDMPGKQAVVRGDCVLYVQVWVVRRGDTF